MTITTTRAAQAACAEPNIAFGRLPHVRPQARGFLQRGSEPAHVAPGDNASIEQMDRERLGFVLLGVGLEGSTVG